MNNNFQIKKLGKAAIECHEAAKRYIDAVTDIGFEQMKLEGKSLDENNFNPTELAEYAAKKLGMEKEIVIRDYLDMLVLEGMIVMETEKTSSH